MKTSAVGLVLVFTKVIEKLGSFGLIVVAARILVKAEFGFFQAVSMYAILVVSIVTFALPSGHLYFLGRVAQEDRKEYASAVQLLLAGIGLLIGVIGAGVTYLFADQVGTLDRIATSVYFLLYCAAATPASGLPNVMVACGEARRASASSIAANVTSIAIALIFAAVTRKSWGILFGLACGAVVQYGILLIRTWAVVKVSLMPIAKRSTLRSVWSYTYPLGLSNAINFISRRFDAMVVTMVASTELYAVYSVGTVEVPVIAVIVGAAWATLVPKFSVLLSNGAFQEAHDLWSRGIIKLAAVIVPVAIATFVFAEDIAVLLFGDGFRESAIPLRCYSVVTAGRFMLIGTLLSAGGHTGYQLRMSFWAVLTTVCVALIVAFSGFPMWTGIGTVCGTIISVVVGLFAVHRLYGYPWSKILPWRILGELLFGSLIIFGLSRAVVAHIGSVYIRVIVGLVTGGSVVGAFLHIRGYISLDWVRSTFRAARAKG